MEWNEIIKKTRLEHELDVDSLSALLEITPEHYEDLENDPREIVESLNLDQVNQLFASLGLSFRNYLWEDGDSALRTEVDLLQKLSLAGKSSEEWEEATGWAVSSEWDRVSVLREYPLAFFRDIAPVIQEDWRHLVRICLPGESY